MIIKTHGQGRNASPDIFASTDGPFVSPFFSKDAAGSPRFNALLGEESAGVVASLGAEAWQQALTRVTKSILTSQTTGGMPVGIVHKIIDTSGGGLDGQLIGGLFAPAVFPNSTQKQALVSAAVQVGLDIALNAISAVPIVGNVLNAVVKIAQGLVQLFRKPKDQIERTVPWQGYSRDVDEDIINKVVIKRFAPDVDWTDFYAPAMPPGPFTFETAGEGKRAAGVFVSAQPDYTTGLGYMPGTQRMVEIVQVARTIEIGAGQGQPSYVWDAVTNVGDYYPATTQWGTVGWGMIEATANDGTGADIFKIQASRLIGMWAEYWEAFFADLIFAIEHHPEYDTEKLFLAKAIAKFLTFKGSPGACHDGTKNQVCFVDPNYIAQSRNLDGFINSNIFNEDNELSYGRQFLRPDESLTTPALKRVRSRQMSALTNSLSCAYVRPRKDQVTGQPAFAAFQDPGPATKNGFDNFGQQLRAECDRARELLLEHPARWKVNYWDVRDVDPQFAERLKNSQQGHPPLGFASEPSKLDPGVDPGPAPEEPQGGVPFGELAVPDGPKKPDGKKATKTIVYVGAAAAAAWLGYKAYKGELGDVKNAVTGLVKK